MSDVRKWYKLVLIPLIFAGSVFAQSSLTDNEKALLTGFENGAKDYIKARNRIESSLPNLPKKATPEQIEAHQTALLKRVQAERKGIGQGSIFTPAAGAVVRSIISREFQGNDKAVLKSKAADAAVGVPVAVNVEYPETKEVMEMPPSLLMALPQIPKELRYRFVGRTLILMDEGNRMVIDYLPNALR